MHQVLPKDQQLRYEEMEYLLPAAAGPDCRREVRDRIRQRALAAGTSPPPAPVASRRVRQVRINDLIDPQAPPLGRPYAAVVTADTPVVVQFLRQDTRQPANAITALPALPIT